MGKKPIKPVKLPNHEMKLKDKKKCTVAGWGYTRTDGEAVSDLQEAEVPIINTAECQRAWNNRLPAKTICAGGIKNGFCQVCCLFCKLACELKSPNILYDE